MSRNKDFLKRIILLMFISLIFTIQVQAAQTAVSISDVSVESGNDVIATIMLKDITSYGTGTIKVTYDPAIAQVTGVEGSTDSTVVISNADNNAGSVSISAWNLNGKTGDIVFADIKFNAVGSSGSSTPLTLDVEILEDTSGNNLPAILDHGTLSITGDPEPTPTPTPPPADGSAVSLKTVIKPAVSIEITPSSVNFGSLGPGENSTKHQLHITNKGSTSIDVTPEVTDTAQNLYVKGVQINAELWSGYQTQLIPSGTEKADMWLKVPVDYAGVGTKEGVLTFWAQQVDEN